jgi:Metallo-peptidase family M12B Reprolysin-like
MLDDIIGKLRKPEDLMPTILLKVYITPFAEKNVREAEKWSPDSAKEALNVVNAIWSKADVTFAISECVVDKPLDMAKSVRNNDQRLLDVLSSRHMPDKQVHVYLVNPIENLAAGGGSYVDGDPEPASFVQWYYKTAPNGRAWAHELGHLLSLDHVDIDYGDERQASLRSNLMTKGLTMGTDLTDKQTAKVKGSKLVKQFAS